MQQPYRRLADGAAGPIDLSSKLLHPGALELIDRVCLRLSKQTEGSVERTGIEVGLSSG